MLLLLAGLFGYFDTGVSTDFIIGAFFTELFTEAAMAVMMWCYWTDGEE